MFRLAFSSLRFRKGAFIATFLSLFVGTAVILACGGLMETGLSSATPPQRLAGAPIVVAGDQNYDLPAVGHGEDADHESATLPERVRLDAGLAGTIAHVPGVASVVPDISFPAELQGDGEDATVPGTQRGHDWASAALTPFTVSDGRQPQRAGEVVLDAATAGRIGAHPGAQVKIAVAGSMHDFTVVGLASTDRPQSTDSFFFSSADAASFNPATGQVDSFGVLPAQGTDLTALRAQLDNALQGKHVVTLTGDDRGHAEFDESANDSELLVILAGVFGGLAVQIVLFVVASTLALSVQQRRREVALLRAIGATPKQLRRMVTGEAMVLGVLATALALVPGAALGGWLFDRLVSFGVVQPVVAFEQGLYPAVAAVLVGLLSAWGAAFVAAGYAGRTRPVEAMQEAAVSSKWLTPMRLWLGVSSVLGAVALAYLTMTVMDGPLASSTAGPAVTLVATAVALFAPGATRLLITVLRPLVRATTGLPGYLASLNARARWIPMAGAVTPIMLATSLAIFMLYFQTTQTAAARTQYQQSIFGDAVVSSSTGGITADTVRTVQRTPGVAGATAIVTSKGYNEKPADATEDEDGVDLTGITASVVAPALQDKTASGRLTDLRGDSIALPSDLAGRLKVVVGDKITMRLGDGARARLTVVATLKPESGEQSALMPVTTLAPHTSVGSPSRILVIAVPGTASDQLLGALSDKLKDQPSLSVGGRDALAAQYEAQDQANAWVNYLIVGLLLVYAAISLVNTVVVATTHRRREFGLQRLTGSTRRQVMSMMTVEALMVAVIGCVLGTVVAGSMLVPFSAAVSDSPIPSGPLWIYPTVVGLAALLTVVSTWVPTWLTLRNRPSPTTLATG